VTAPGTGATSPVAAGGAGGGAAGVATWVLGARPPGWTGREAGGRVPLAGAVGAVAVDAVAGTRGNGPAVPDSEAVTEPAMLPAAPAPGPGCRVAVPPAPARAPEPAVGSPERALGWPEPAALVAEGGGGDAPTGGAEGTAPDEDDPPGTAPVTGAVAAVATETRDVTRAGAR
jgi:hypothetical protein